MFRFKTSLLTYSRAYATKVTAKAKSKPTSYPNDNIAPISSRVATVETSAISPTFKQRTGQFALKTYKPKTPGTRHWKRPINDHLWKGKPLRKLTYAKTGQGRGGRNHTGRITVRHRGGGHKRRIRTVDFHRFAPGKHTVDRIEYDPNRSAHIALITNNATGVKSYILAEETLRAGAVVESYRAGLPQELIDSMGGVIDPGMLAVKTALPGNCLPAKLIPTGTQIYNVGSTVGKGGIFCRSAGCFATVVSKEETDEKCTEVVIRMMSGELRRISPDACATIGVSSNPYHHYRQLGKAGRSRYLGRRPSVRGVAMNTVDHPHGGGRGKSKGNRIPVSPWGQQAKSGFKTRKKSKVNPFVVKERPRNHGKRRSKSTS